MNAGLEAAPVTDTRMKQVTKAMVRHGYRADGLIEVLHVVQASYGFVPMDLMKRIAHEMRISPSKIYGVVTFYHFFSLKPKGEHNCVVCTGTACHVKGAGAVLGEIATELGLRAGETTPDGKLGVQTARCLGCCGLAPVVVMDDQILARVNPATIAGQIREKMEGAVHAS